MAKYHVYGIGNALVDKEFEVEDSFFSEHGIEKGLMTLVDEEQQEILLKALTDKYDLKKQAGGGSAGNTLYAFSNFGGEAYYACKVANDDTGDYFLEQLGHHNIDNNVSRREEGTSGRCVVMVSPDAERTMHTYLGVSADISEKEIDFDAAKDSEYIYIEGYLVTSPPAKEAITKLKKFAEDNGVKTAMTFSDPAMLEYFRDEVKEVLGTGVDLLFCNEKEAKLWADTPNFDEACELMKTKAKQFVITRGPKGALAWDGERFVEIEGNPVKAIDTNGAGDMFAGAFLYAVTQGHDMATAGKLASKASSEVVQVFGPRLEANRHQELVDEIVAQA
ncbi:MAG: adenosine kinase [Pseudohongiellaceae bacterium]|jgi:fructokinase